MQKTEHIKFNCAAIHVDGCNNLKVWAMAKSPDVDHILTDIHSDDLIPYVVKNYGIEEIFTKEELHKWATENGYTK